MKQGLVTLEKSEECFIHQSVKISGVYSKHLVLCVILSEKYIKKSIVFRYYSRLNVRHWRVTEIYLNMTQICNSPVKLMITKSHRKFKENIWCAAAGKVYLSYVAVNSGGKVK